MRSDGFFARLRDFVEDGVFREENYALSPAERAKIDTDTPENRWLISVQHSEKPVRARLMDWFRRKGFSVFNSLYRVASVFICMTLIGVLLAVVSFLPAFGSGANPAVNEVMERYLSKSIEETGAANAVAGMISAYRGFDTLGEAHVLFVAACSVIILLRVDPTGRRSGKLRDPDRTGEDLDFEPNSDLILRNAAKLLVPLSFILGLYVILNGASSPGGGFSGGALMGAGLILCSAAFGFGRTERFFDDRMYHLVKTVCLAVYALLMAYFIFMGANGWDDHIWLGVPGGIISGGLILPINVAVGFEVACTMYCFYALFRKGGL